MKRLVTVAAVASLALAACGSDDGSSTGGVDATPSTDAAPSDSRMPTTDVGPTNDAPSDDVESRSDEFPVTIEHKFGETTVDAEPQRVVSVGFNEHDFLLALGVVPVGLRDWYGDQPNGVWPWAQDELGGATPEVIAADALNFEQIAALDPDLIVGVWSGMTEDDYALLSAIAPTVAQPDTYDDYGTPWHEQTQILGRATGRSAEATEVVTDIEDRFAEIRDDHPEWAGQSSSVAFVTDDGPGAYTSQDTRSRIMSDLGFRIPAVNDSVDDGSFYLELSPEDISALDVDVLVWVAGSQEGLEAIVNELPTRSSLAAVQEGREIFASIELGAAFSHGSPLSIDFALDELVPEIEAAVDGDPGTPVPSSLEVGVAAVGESSAAPAPQDEASEAFSRVFDSTVGFDDQAANLENADALAEAIASYAAAGEGFGGISLVPTDVTVDGDTAEVTYDVNFGENPAYSDQTGSISRIAGEWVVSEDEFCSFMASARVSC